MDPGFPVLLRLLGPSERQDELVAHARDLGPVFARQPGFRSWALHRAREGGEVLVWLVWDDEAGHAACQESDDWEEAGAALTDLLASGGIDVELHTYDPVARLPDTN